MDARKQALVQKLYQQYEQPMYRIAYAILHQEQQAEDAVSEAFLRILRNLEKFRKMEEPEIRNYMVKTIRSTAINQYRQNQQNAKRYTVWDDSVLELPDPAGNPEEQICREIQTEELLHLLQSLSETDRTIFLLRCQNGLSFREIAGRLSLKEATARKRFERARKKLQQKKGELSYVQKAISI